MMLSAVETSKQGSSSVLEAHNEDDDIDSMHLMRIELSCEAGEQQEEEQKEAGDEEEEEVFVVKSPNTQKRQLMKAAALWTSARQQRWKKDAAATAARWSSGSSSQQQELSPVGSKLLLSPTTPTSRAGNGKFRTIVVFNNNDDEPCREDEEDPGTTADPNKFAFVKRRSSDSFTCSVGSMRSSGTSTTASASLSSLGVTMESLTDDEEEKEEKHRNDERQESEQELAKESTTLKTLSCQKDVPESTPILTTKRPSQTADEVICAAVQGTAEPPSPKESSMIETLSYPKGAHISAPGTTIKRPSQTAEEVICAVVPGTNKPRGTAKPKKRKSKRGSFEKRRSKSLRDLNVASDHSSTTGRRKVKNTSKSSVKRTSSLRDLTSAEQEEQHKLQKSTTRSGRGLVDKDDTSQPPELIGKLGFNDEHSQRGASRIRSSSKSSSRRSRSGGSLSVSLHGVAGDISIRTSSRRRGSRTDQKERSNSVGSLQGGLNNKEEPNQYAETVDSKMLRRVSSKKKERSLSWRNLFRKVDRTRGSSVDVVAVVEPSESQTPVVLKGRRRFMDRSLSRNSLNSSSHDGSSSELLLVKGGKQDRRSKTRRSLSRSRLNCSSHDSSSELFVEDNEQGPTAVDKINGKGETKRRGRRSKTERSITRKRLISREDDGSSELMAETNADPVDTKRKVRGGRRSKTERSFSREGLKLKANQGEDSSELKNKGPQVEKASPSERTSSQCSISPRLRQSIERSVSRRAQAGGFEGDNDLLIEQVVAVVQTQLILLKIRALSDNIMGENLCSDYRQHDPETQKTSERSLEQGAKDRVYRRSGTRRSRSRDSLVTGKVKSSDHEAANNEDDTHKQDDGPGSGAHNERRRSRSERSLNQRRLLKKNQDEFETQEVEVQPGQDSKRSGAESEVLDIHASTRRRVRRERRLLRSLSGREL